MDIHVRLPDDRVVPVAIKPNMTVSAIVAAAVEQHDLNTWALRRADGALDHTKTLADNGVATDEVLELYSA